jgi:hypothetical protein
MLNFVKSTFRGFFVVLLWIILFGGAIAGFVIGGGEDTFGVVALLGLILGALAGLIVDIIVGGFVATIIAIEENTRKDR